MDRHLRLGSKWMSGNEIGLYRYTDSMEGNQVINENNQIQLMGWSSDVQTPSSRKLINETYSIFMDLQKSIEQSEKIVMTSLVQCSRQYRSVIQSCSLELRELIAQENSETDDSVNSELSLFSIIEMVWHLCEIVLVDTVPGGYGLEQLLDWVNWNFTWTDKVARDVLSLQDPSSDPNYWEAIQGFVMQGRTKDAINLLSLHPSRDRRKYDGFSAFDELLQAMPRYQAYPGQTADEFMIRWKRWQYDCRQTVENGEFTQWPELENICQIICGNEAVIDECRDCCQTWYQFAICKLLYTNPVCKMYDLGTPFELAMQLFAVDNEDISSLDKIILSISDFNIHQIIKECSECLPNWWLVAHLCDLFYHAGLLKEHQLDYGDQMREFLLLEYASSLMAHGSLWTVAADYLMKCPTYGLDHLEAHISRIPIQDDAKAFKVIRLCQRFGLAEQASSICRIMAINNLKRDNLGASLSWSMRSKDSKFTSYIAEQLLSRYAQTGKFSHVDVIENLGTNMLISDKLTFLGQYYEFHQLYRDGRLNEAASLLVSLLTSNLAPKRFWHLLLIDALPLIESSKVIFNSSQTYELLHCVEQIKLTKDPISYVAMETEQTEQETTKWELIRLALSRNLARSILNSS